VIWNYFRILPLRKNRYKHR